METQIPRIGEQNRLKLSLAPRADIQRFMDHNLVNLTGNATIGRIKLGGATELQDFISRRTLKSYHTCSSAQLWLRLEVE